MRTAERLSGRQLLAHPVATAVVLTLYERGYPEASVEEFIERARITRAEFDHRFVDKREVTIAVLDAHLGAFVDRVGRAYGAVDGWPDNLRAAGYEISRYMLENPELTWFVMVGVADAAEVMRAGRDRLFGWAAGLIEEGRAATPEGREVPASASLLAVGATVEALRRRLADGIALDIEGDLPRLMYAAVKPYLGEEAARAELAIELPRDLRSP
jgi:AcrR family transcriptional regulator